MYFIVFNYGGKKVHGPPDGKWFPWSLNYYYMHLADI